MAIKARPESFPPNEAVAVAPSDANNIPGIPESGAELYIGVAGDITVDMAVGGVGVLFKAAPVGPFKYKVRKVYATGTLATNIVAAW